MAEIGYIPGMDKLSRVNNDMRNLLKITEIVTVFLNNELHVRRFTSGADKPFKLIPGDVGRPFFDIVSDLLYPVYLEMNDEAQEVLRTLVFRKSRSPPPMGAGFWCVSCPIAP